MSVEAQLESIRTGRGLLDDANAMETIPSLLRSAFRAPAGKKFVAADLSQIELRVLAWLTDCKPMLKTFADNRDLYIDFGARMYGVDYDDVTKDQRQIAKPAVLSCGYGSGGGNLEYDDSGDEIKTGLWGYAANMGIDMTRQQAWDAVNKYRAEYAEVPRFWDSVMAHITSLMSEGNNFNDIAGGWFNRLYYRYFPGKMLRVMLPSGRWLTYLKPKLERSGEVTFDAKLGGNIFRRRLYGSLHFENLVQAIARDVMAVGMVRATDAGIPLVGHTHDELIGLVLAELAERMKRQLAKSMSDPIDWADGLPLKVDPDKDAWVGDVYRK